MKMISNIYKLQTPIINLKSLQDVIPKYETVPLWWDDGWYLFYINIFGNIYYMNQ